MINKLLEIVSVLFQRTSVERILSSKEKDKIYYDSISMPYLKDLLLTYGSNLSDSEIELQISEVACEMFLRQDIQDRSMIQIDVFELLFFCIPQILIFHENRVVCRYEYLLAWNNLIRAVGEGLPVYVMYAKHNLECGRNWVDLYWPPVIGHNNRQLNRILMRGMADNHFHLRCSSPYFAVSWINLMNHPGNERLFTAFDKIEANYRDKKKKSEINIVRQPLKLLVYKAALIRLYLCSRLQGFLFLREIDKQPFQTSEEVRQFVTGILDAPLEMEIYMSVLQTMIHCLRMQGNQDYMLNFVGKEADANEQEYEILAGERWFLYRVLLEIRHPVGILDRLDKNLFFAYIRIKNELRYELVQTNEIVGFENFRIYQGRKDFFSHVGSWETAEAQLARLAVRTVLNNPSMKYMEIRISPASNERENLLNIEGYDRAILSEYCRGIPGSDRSGEILYERRMLPRGAESVPYAMEGIPDRTEMGTLRERFYYVFHFHKKPDTNKNGAQRMECRHYHYRKEIRKKAEGIVMFRVNYPEYGRRVVGVDACSQELGCRPEVVAPDFRLLKHYVNPYPEAWKRYELPQLKITYHVGEEFLDLVDGLRAIDEAIRFLGLDCGDRLGHALALGIDPELWYQAKGGRITLSLQDYLDNVVWLHHAMNKYKIDDKEALKGWLEEQFSYYFSYIYQPPLSGGQNEENNGIEIRQGKYDIHTYYLSWLLRGDSPELYKSGELDREFFACDEWSRYAINRAVRRNDDIRMIYEVTRLYYMYHYDHRVRTYGSQIQTFSVKDSYIRGVAAVQRALCEEVTRRGIGIEVAPSSNVNISVIKFYRQHPIKKLYNYGLTVDPVELADCPQMNISVNTDNNGVFATRLENEYALLARDLEEESTPEGRPRYQKEFIYQWLENLRIMGLEQGFGGSIPGR